MAKVNKDIPVTIEIDGKPVATKITKRSSIKQSAKSTNTSNPVANILIALAGIFAILPAVIYGIFTFFGAGFKYGLDAAVKMYSDLMADTKTWTR